MALYFPINRAVQGGAQLSLLIDRLIPLYPWTVIPYLGGTLLFILLPVWATFRARAGEFEAYTVSVLLAAIVSYVVYIVFPTFVIRPESLPQDVFSKIVTVLYQADRAYNAAPSGHAFYALVSFLYLRRWAPRYKLTWLVFILLVLASTVLTKQHYVLDLVSGLALGALAYAAGRFIQGKRNLRFASEKSL